MLLLMRVQVLGRREGVLGSREGEGLVGGWVGLD